MRNGIESRKRVGGWCESREVRGGEGMKIKGSEG